MTEIQRVIKDSFEKLYTTKHENLDEMDKFLDSYNIPRLNQDDLTYLDRYITIEEIKWVTKRLPPSPVSRSAWQRGEERPRKSFSIFILFRVFVMNSTQLNVFSAPIYMIIWFLFFFLIWCIMFFDLHILNYPCISGIKPTWSWCMIFLMMHWILFAKIVGSFSRIDHMLAHRTYLHKIKRVKIVQTTFSDHNALKLEVRYKEI